MPTRKRAAPREGGSVPRWAALVLTLAVALVVLWPVLVHPDRDGFPLSTYPMFSSPRASEASFATVVGLDATGRSYWLSPFLTNGTREVVQASVVVDRQVRAGRAGQLCAEVAARLAGAEPGGRAERRARSAAGPGGAGPAERTAAPAAASVVERVEVVTVRLDLVQYFEAGRPPAGPRTSERSAVHADCPVPR